MSPRALLVADAANPEWISVPLVGWSHARALFEVADAHLVTQARNQEAIARAGWTEGEEFTALDTEAVARPVWRARQAVQKATGLGWTAGTAMDAPAYYYFEQQVWSVFGERIRRGEFDVVHRITPVSPVLPSTLASRCKRAGVPFVVGPLNGGVPWPREFRDLQHREGEWLSYVRDAYKWMPGHDAMRRDAAAILIGSRITWHQVAARFRDRCVYLPENAIDPGRFSGCVEGEVGRPLRVVFVGRLVPLKGVDMLIEAAAPLVREGKVVLDIVGDGDEMASLKDQVVREEITRGVRLDGWVEHENLEARLLESDVLAFPSVREFGGGVVLECMALGLCPVVADYAGPAELVTGTTGIRVPLGNRGKVVEGFRRALARLAQEPEQARELGLAARRRVQQLFTWPRKAEQVLEVYRWVLGQRPKPDFGMPFPDPPSELLAARLSGGAGPLKS